MISQEEQERLIRNFETASNAIRKITGGKYGQTYQDCVKAGLKPQIRKKYR
jgi:hypothetical protein